ncbi:hypothetical protein HU200_053207 [Digitaria exilis]|uniref:Uncharacterized protein n=1 Tax=Digitaria exilis TaxID=1010633 RepID=A0A835E565_9POAL|nr:hypothetical protein HU200_053207 [Digitaria exilis]
MEASNMMPRVDSLCLVLASPSPSSRLLRRRSLPTLLLLPPPHPPTTLTADEVASPSRARSHAPSLSLPHLPPRAARAVAASGPDGCGRENQIEEMSPGSTIVSGGAAIGTRISYMMALLVAGGMGCILPHFQAWRQALRSPRIAATTATVTAEK